ncbi:MAG TPA: hypothetical protein VJQ43_06325, partial [Thermoplasmata archaeon]|nr:hypothetical protein [Thermoplasmata archaeon]
MRLLRAAGSPPVLALGVALLFALAVPLAVPSASGAGAHPGAGSAPASVVPTAAHLASTPAAGPSATGRGVFFDNHPVPNAPIAQRSCPAGACINASNDPSINWTTYGTIAVAYTAWTNASPCAASVRYAQSEVGVVVSTNGGSSWSAPRYLGAPATCSAAVAKAEPSAWQPSLTSLANGTLVLAYIAFNASAPITSVGFGPVSWTVTSDRLLVSESYDNGTSWTSPSVLNVSDNPSMGASAFTAERPWATASGSRVFVTWMNVTEGLGVAGGIGVGSAAVEMLTSANGGVTWPTSPTTLPVRASPGGPAVAINPDAVVVPNGPLVVAYTTNLSYHAVFGCQNGTCLGGNWEGDVVAASTSNNGTSFTVSTIASSVALAPSRFLDAFVDPSPQLAYGNASGQLVVTYAAATVLTTCLGGSCHPILDPEVVFVANSSTSGASWSADHLVIPALWQLGTFGVSFGYNPGVAVDRNGTIDLAFSYDNYSICQPSVSNGVFCGPQQEAFAQSTDNGATFTGPYFVSSNWSQLVTNPTNPDGEYATVVAAGGQLWLAWTLDVCPMWTTSAYSACFPTPPPGYAWNGSTSQIVLSKLFTGPGISLTFSESGLTAGLSWNVSVMGNDRTASAPTSLVVSGIPSGENLSWILNTEVLAHYGDRFNGVPSILPVASFSTSSTISVVYTEQVLLNISTVPAFPSYVAPAFPFPYCFSGSPATAWNTPNCPSLNYNVTPGTGPEWLAPGTRVVLNVTPIGSYYCGSGVLCFNNIVLNLSFLSWSGVGNGSVNTTSNRTTITVNSPINETANFLMTGWCSVQYSPPASVGCLHSNTTLAFHETGLPNGTAWTVTTTSAFGSSTVTNT